MEVITTLPGRITLLGILLGIMGIGIIGYAGFLKDRQLDDKEKTSAIEEFSLRKGIIVAITSGILSACFAFGIAAGKSLVTFAGGHLADPLFANSLLFSVIMAGGLTTNLLYCGWSWYRNKSWKHIQFTSGRMNRNNLIFCALAGTTWYCQFLFYGMGTTQMGRYDFVSWSLHMSFIIIFSNFWGIIRREWRSVRLVTVHMMLSGILILLISTAVIGYGNSISITIAALWTSIVNT